MDEAGGHGSREGWRGPRHRFPDEKERLGDAQALPGSHARTESQAPDVLLFRVATSRHPLSSRLQTVRRRRRRSGGKGKAAP